MKLKSLTLALLAAGVVVTGSATVTAATTAPQASGALPEIVRNSGAVGDKPSMSVAPLGSVTAPNYRGIVERYGPAVVGVNVESAIKTNTLSLPGYGNQEPDNNIPTHGMGSGFIVNADGVILTNAHVVLNASEVIVKLSDRREFKAKVLGSDLATDVAVLKIDAHNLPVVSLGNSTKLRVGDYVLAIGSPFGFEQSATAGIVSAKGRSLPGDGYVPFIQTDVAVNPGNSGGPLFDANGKVVGINSQIYSRTGGYQGLSFSIPIDVALRVKDQIVATGKVEHARLGVMVQQLTQSLAESFRLKQPDGALVANVTPGGAAARAGIEAGDVILQYNKQPILESTDLSALVSMAMPGEKVTLEVWRGGKKHELSVTLSEAKNVVADSGSATGSASQARLGVAVRGMTSKERTDAKVISGVLVEQVAGPAAKAGIETGDIILAVNGTPVKTTAQLQLLVSKNSQQVAVLIQRGEEKIFIPVKLG